jgi:hypothetical protein
MNLDTDVEEQFNTNENIAVLFKSIVWIRLMELFSWMTSVRNLYVLPFRGVPPFSNSSYQLLFHMLRNMPNLETFGINLFCTPADMMLTILKFLENSTKLKALDFRHGGYSLTEKLPALKRSSKSEVELQTLKITADAFQFFLR